MLVHKSIQQIEFIGQLQNLDANCNATDAGNDQSMFVLTILEKIKETRLTFSQGSVTVWSKIANYQKSIIKPTNTQLKKLKSTSKNKLGTTVIITKKNFQDE